MKYEGVPCSLPPCRRWVKRPMVALGGGGWAAVLSLEVEAKPRQDDLSPPASHGDDAL
jgi:hypothetical protein